VSDRNGEETNIIERDTEIYGLVIGHIMLEPKAKPIFDRLDVAKRGLGLSIVDRASRNMLRPSLTKRDAKSPSLLRRK
jgi:hypothetical protein